MNARVSLNIRCTRVIRQSSFLHYLRRYQQGVFQSRYECTLSLFGWNSAMIYLSYTQPCCSALACMTRIWAISGSKFWRGSSGIVYFLPVRPEKCRNNKFEWATATFFLILFTELINWHEINKHAWWKGVGVILPWCSAGLPSLTL
jgi:hypothetical protein